MTQFKCEKRPASGSKGMVVTNHPLASGAGAQVLLQGGNAVDAAVTSLFALSVVEPMMIGLLGGGVTHIRTASGSHHIIDGLSTAPGKASANLYQPVSDDITSYRKTAGRKNEVGPLAVAVPGALAAWCEVLSEYGTISLSEAVEPAIEFAKKGFIVSPYLTDCTTDTADDLKTDPALAARFLPNGNAISPGTRLKQPQYAETLRLIGQQGPNALYGGELGDAFIKHLADGGIMALSDLTDYRVAKREPIYGSYRGFEIAGPPPPASAGVHITQMLNVLEYFDVAAIRFGTPDSVHLLAEVLKLAFADRAQATADPAFVDVPVTKLIDKAYAASRFEQLDMRVAQSWAPGVSGGESSSTTHVTVADSDGNVVSTTQTINGLFGACVEVPGTGLIANNYMYNFDPRSGKALSVAPGKRVFTSMAPMMVSRGGAIRYALGLPGAMRIFPSAMQTIVNLIDHQMPLQEAVEAPRIWTEGGALELEPAYSDSLASDLANRGHEVLRVNRIAGGMNAIEFGPDGLLTGAACWRADGTPVGIAGGNARPGVRFSIR